MLINIQFTPVTTVIFLYSLHAAGLVKVRFSTIEVLQIINIIIIITVLCHDTDIERLYTFYDHGKIEAWGR